MADTFSVTEVSRITGLAPHTLRYYEQQFPVLLKVERTRGGHRIYRQQHIDLFKAIIQLLKEEKVSIKEARCRLGEPDNSIPCNTSNSSEEKFAQEFENGDISKMLMVVIEKLDRICRNNDNRDRMLMNFFKAKTEDRNDDLIDQISRCRKETHETVKLCQTIIRQGFRVN